MPSLGADMEAGTLVEWLKQPGDALSKGDIIAVVDTDKGAIDIEVFQDGILERALVSPGEKVPVGTPLATIRGIGEPAGAAPETPPPAAAPTPPALPPQPAPPPHERRASPAARKAAEDLHVDIASVDGTGPGGAITREDVERAGAQKARGARGAREGGRGCVRRLGPRCRGRSARFRTSTSRQPST
jgi:pyruvate dehydrogenase E2 component (dihydrolipoamide acetyltransferase)